MTAKVHIGEIIVGALIALLLIASAHAA